MTTYSLKTKFQNLLRPIAYQLVSVGVTPNQVTIFTCLLSLVYSLAIVFFKQSLLYYSFPVFFVLRMALNAIDGIMAKEKNKTSKLGAMLNEIGDVLSDAFMSAVFLFIAGINIHYVWLFIYLSLFVECSAMWTYLLKNERFYNGPLGKSDRGIILTLLAFNVGWVIQSGNNSYLFVNEILIVSFPLLVLTIFNRVKNGI